MASIEGIVQDTSSIERKGKTIYSVKVGGKYYSGFDEINFNIGDNVVIEYEVNGKYLNYTEITKKSQNVTAASIKTTEKVNQRPDELKYEIRGLALAKIATEMVCKYYEIVEETPTWEQLSKDYAQCFEKLEYYHEQYLLKKKQVK